MSVLIFPLFLVAEETNFLTGVCALMPQRENYKASTGSLNIDGRRELRGAGFLLQSGDLIPVPGTKAREAATHLIGGFEMGLTPPGLSCGTVVWFEGTDSKKFSNGGKELGPRELGTQTGGFWTGRDLDLMKCARLDRQKYFPREGNWFCNYQIQIGSVSVACVLIRVNFDVGVRLMRHAFHLSLENIKNVWVDPTDGKEGYFRLES